MSKRGLHKEAYISAKKKTSLTDLMTTSSLVTPGGPAKRLEGAEEKGRELPANFSNGGLVFLRRVAHRPDVVLLRGVTSMGTCVRFYRPRARVECIYLMIYLLVARWPRVGVACERTGVCHASTRRMFTSPGP